MFFIIDTTAIHVSLLIYSSYFSNYIIMYLSGNIYVYVYVYHTHKC